MHIKCFTLSCIELIGMSKIEKIYDEEFEEYIETRIANKI